MSASVTKIARTSGQRRCYYIPYEGFIEGYGYRVSIVFEFTEGHFPTGDDDWRTDPSKRKPSLVIANSMSIKE